LRLNLYPALELIERWNIGLNNKNKGKQMDKKYLHGHTSFDTAYIVENWPWGYKLRTTKYFWIEKNDRGMRLVTQTINPKNGKICAPKKSTYSVFLVLYIEDEKVFCDCLDRWENEKLEEFLEKEGSFLSKVDKITIEMMIKAGEISKTNFENYRKNRDEGLYDTASERQAFDAEIGIRYLPKRARKERLTFISSRGLSKEDALQVLQRKLNDFKESGVRILRTSHLVTFVPVKECLNKNGDVLSHSRVLYPFPGRDGVTQEPFTFAA